ncbi:tRNA-dihydrouridine synthase [Wickerhamomyces ciferrii]|uniref:tRNA-dihydrouridine synthase n=1 Tax=Wickerhamomyces ciferrii (strain ATCC 14091 / BCRC 22168 / CBS 111 / JCM 3599 / NBRC 0793 / NRRL Y-1031 F-60-10) TaxID=1206466 RepID=K0KSH0_WICCF|nr:tRNA-dihydrouridine synthase [Wickerhamomyces ciferrii]CCH46121.1 tRNA-dihydrouridine synthase [Wickerhamomyces ciferrii]
MTKIEPRNPENNPIRIIERCRKEGRPVFIAGPMVRYSKLPFRSLVREYNTDLVYSPMILAREFVRNEFARLSDFTTNNYDTPLIVQVGTNNVTDLLRFVEMIHPFVDGIGINCGCPIKEQIREGIGAALMSEPDLVSDMVYAVKQKYGDKVCIETKIRIHPDLNETVKFVQKVEKAGVDFITVHGRTKTTRSSQPANFEAIKLMNESVSVPVIANGDCFSLNDAYEIVKKTKVDGVMAVRGILDNPALFAGYEKAPWGCIEKFWEYSTSYGLTYRLLQHHLSCMLDGRIPKELYKEMMDIKTLAQLIDFFDNNFILKRSNEEGFGTGIEIPFKTQRALHI